MYVTNNMGNRNGKVHRLRRVEFDSPRKLAELKIEEAGKNQDQKDIFLITIKDKNLRTIDQELLTRRGSTELVKKWRQSYESREDVYRDELPQLSPKTRKRSLTINDENEPANLSQLKGWAEKIQDWEDETGRPRSYTK